MLCLTGLAQTCKSSAGKTFRLTSNVCVFATLAMKFHFGVHDRGRVILETSGHGSQVVRLQMAITKYVTEPDTTTPPSRDAQRPRVS